MTKIPTISLGVDAPPGLRITSVAHDLWRVTDVRGLVRGHVRMVIADRAPRFRVERFHPASRAFRTIGEFWSAREALDCVHHQG